MFDQMVEPGQPDPVDLRMFVPIPGGDVVGYVADQTELPLDSIAQNFVLLELLKAHAAHKLRHFPGRIADILQIGPHLLIRMHPIRLQPHRLCR